MVEIPVSVRVPAQVSHWADIKKGDLIDAEITFKPTSDGWKMIIDSENCTTDGMAMITLFHKIIEGNSIVECIEKFEEWCMKNKYEFEIVYTEIY